MLFQEIEIVWNQILSEAHILINKEPSLTGFYYAHILNHKSFSSALSYILSSKLGNKSISAISVRDIINTIYDCNHEIIISAIQDIREVYNRDPAIECYSTPFLYSNGFHVLQAYRISNYLWNQSKTELAIYFYNRISTIFSVDIHPAAKIGCGVIFDHAIGIVIGETSVVRNNVTIFHSVTLGSTGKHSGIRHPIVNEDTIIGAGSKVLGKIEIGSKVKIGAGSVVLVSIPPGCTAIGIPAKIVTSQNNKQI
ncbi:MAG: serine O-acetyltransferase EpsC [Buchnera aphidicola (Schlechtendalia peitan)]